MVKNIPLPVGILQSRVDQECPRLERDLRRGACRGGWQNDAPVAWAATLLSARSRGLLQRVRGGVKAPGCRHRQVPGGWRRRLGWLLCPTHELPKTQLLSPVWWPCGSKVAHCSGERWVQEFQLLFVWSKFLAAVLISTFHAAKLQRLKIRFKSRLLKSSADRP